MTAHSKTEVDPDVQLTLRLEDLKSLSAKFNGEAVPIEVTSRLKNYLERTVFRATSSGHGDQMSFTLEEAIQSVSQVKVQEVVHGNASTSSGSLLGKRMMRDEGGAEGGSGRENIKDRTRCRVCKQHGHWWQDRPQCKEKMMERRSRAAEQKKNGDIARHARFVEKSEDDTPPPKPSGSLFQL